LATTRLSDFLNNSQLFVASCSVLLGFETVIIADSTTNFVSISLVFFATLFIYNTSRLTIDIQPGEKQRLTGLTISGRKLHLLLAAFSIFASFIFLTQLHFHQLLVFALTAIFSIAYMMPLRIREKRIPGIRNSLIFKNILLSVIWTLATCLLPLSENTGQIFGEPMIWMMARRFLFIYALTTIFDLKDLESDKMEGVRTIARSAGFIGTRIISLVAMSIFTLLILLDPHLTNYAYKAALLTSAFITALIIAGVHPQENRNAFVFVVDGAMAIQALLVIGFHFA
jgi:4-hydroxybenzoate polyprenyltransferase